MARAPVPETAVHESRDPKGPEHHVGFPPERRYGTRVDSVTEPESPQLCADGEFWRRVSLGLCAHPEAHGV